MHPDELVVGNRYRIWHKSPSERKVRYSIMDYLGREATESYKGRGPNLSFNARPVAGTQSMPPHWIKHIEQVEKNTTITLNRIAT